MLPWAARQQIGPFLLAVESPKEPTQIQALKQELVFFKQCFRLIYIGYNACGSLSGSSSPSFCLVNRVSLEWLSLLNRSPTHLLLKTVAVHAGQEVLMVVDLHFSDCC